MQRDVTKLRQILLNLLSNAAKFTENGTIRLSALRLAGADGGDWMVFRVSDTGLGMDEEQIGRLFQRFTQADASTTRKFGGTGLGLSSPRPSASCSGATCRWTSAPGQGSDLQRSSFPRRSSDDSESQREVEQATAGFPDRAGAAPGAKGTVLVIDDDPAQRTS